MKKDTKWVVVAPVANQYHCEGCYEYSDRVKRRRDPLTWELYRRVDEYYLCRKCWENFLNSREYDSVSMTPRENESHE